MPGPLLPEACSQCGSRLDDGASPLTGSRTPSVGDFSVCWYCNHVTVFTRPDGGRRELTAEEIDEAANDPAVGEVITRLLQRRRPLPQRGPR